MEHLPGETPRAFNVPGVVVGLIAAMVAVHLFRLYGPLNDELILYYFAFIPARLGGGMVMDGDLLDRGARYWSLLTYAFIHADWLHLAMNSFWMLAFGSLVARRLTPGGFLLLSGGGAIAGALAYYALHPGQSAVLVGASAAVSAQVAGATRYMFAWPQRLGWSEPELLETGRPLSLSQTFSNRRSLMFILIWLGLNFAFGVTGFGTPEGNVLIAWEAHVGGFAAGLLCLGFLAKGRTAN
jgi:membrane associated rhomboid family serine protease